MKNVPPPKLRFVASQMPSAPARAVVVSSFDPVVEPAELSRLGHDGLARRQAHLEHGHRGAADHSIHGALYRL